MGRARLALNLGLLVLAAALGSLVYFQPGVEPESSDEPAVADAKPDEVEQIQLRPREGTAAVLSREGDRWKIAEPQEAPADTAAVQRILDLLEMPSKSRVGSEVEQPERYGLGDPELVIEMAERRIALGSEHPMKAQRYIQVGDTVHLVEARRLSRLEPAWTSYVSRRLVPRNSSITRLELPDATLVRNDEGSWEGETASGEPVSPETAEATARAWRMSRAADIRAVEAPENSAQQEGTATVRVHLEGAETPLVYHRIDGEDGPQLHRLDPALTYQLRGNQVASLLEAKASGNSQPGAEGSSQPGAEGSQAK